MKHSMLIIDDDANLFQAAMDGIADKCTSIDDALSKFKEGCLYDIISLDGVMPMGYELDSEYYEFVSILDTKQKELAGYYLIYLMKKYNINPKVVILHSYDDIKAHNMYKLMIHHMSDKFMMVVRLEKKYMFWTYFESKMNELVESFDSKMFLLPQSETEFGLLLNKGKKSYLINGLGIQVMKNGVLVDDPNTLVICRSDEHKRAFAIKKLNEGYVVVKNDYRSDTPIPFNYSYPFLLSR